MFPIFHSRKASAPTGVKISSVMTKPISDQGHTSSSKQSNGVNTREAFVRTPSPFESHRSNVHQQVIEAAKYSKSPPQPTAMQTSNTDDRPQPPPPSRLEIMRYRAHYGVNLGSCFVLEKWLTPFAFPHDATSSQTSELAAVSLSVTEIGIEATRANFEHRWHNFMHDSDFDWLVNNAHCTSLRLPIGYWDLGHDFVIGTVFEQYASIYTNAWNAIKTICNKASARGIGVLLDFHALPGGANTAEHSGTNSGVAALWTDKANLDLAQRCLEFIANQTQLMDNIIGIQVCNEADYGAPGMYDWYDSVYRSLSVINPTMPLVISDGWDLTHAINYCLKKNTPTTNQACPLLIDTHKYYCFKDSDKAMTPQAIINKIPSELDALNDKDGHIAEGGAVQVIVGEYSCVLSDSSWSQKGNTDKSTLVKKFGNIQSSTWQAKAGGSYFWTYKMDWMPGGEWGFVNVTNIEAVVPPRHLTKSLEEVHGGVKKAQAEFKNLFSTASKKHREYWETNASGVAMEHWRFDYGYRIGFADACAFFMARLNASSGVGGGDRIGLLEIWILKRITECQQSGTFLWEFEQGFRNGVQDFEMVAKVSV